MTRIIIIGTARNFPSVAAMFGLPQKETKP